jgi:hypothetical protein
MRHDARETEPVAEARSGPRSAAGSRVVARRHTRPDRIASLIGSEVATVHNLQ